MIIIAGAGLTGLSTAYFLKNKAYRVYEAGDSLGGLCRSVKSNGFTFDYTGHLLHMKDKHSQALVNTLLPGKLKKITRNAAVYYRNRFVPYPFQANIYSLPREVAFECLMGFIETCMRKRTKPTPANFKSWAVMNFGEGIARHFFIPYNEKLFQTRLEKLTSNWAGWAIPRPTLQEVVQGATGFKNTGMGYNASFLYPVRSGIEILPESLAKHVRDIRLGQKIVSINMADKTATLSNGRQEAYDTLVSTMPLPELLRIICDLPAAFRRAAKRLRYVSVQNLNIGINRSNASEFHWIYFPEPEFPFYRVGFYSNFSSFSAPRGTTSMYIEISSQPENMKTDQEVTEQSIEGLRKCGILKRGDRIVEKKILNIDCAYVIFDKYQRDKTPQILRMLRKNHIIPAGRYGLWTYSSMEDSIIQGKKTADSIR